MADKNRVRQVAMKLVERDTFDGHTYSLLHMVAHATAKTLRVDYDEVVDALSHMEGTFVVEGKRIMLTEIVEAEDMIASRINALLEN